MAGKTGHVVISACAICRKRGAPHLTAGRRDYPVPLYHNNLARRLLGLRQDPTGIKAHWCLLYARVESILYSSVCISGSYSTLLFCEWIGTQNFHVLRPILGLIWSSCTSSVFIEHAILEKKGKPLWQRSWNQEVLFRPMYQKIRQASEDGSVKVARMYFSVLAQCWGGLLFQCQGQLGWQYFDMGGKLQFAGLQIFLMGPGCYHFAGVCEFLDGFWIVLKEQ